MMKELYDYDQLQPYQGCDQIQVLTSHPNNDSFSWQAVIYKSISATEYKKILVSGPSQTMLLLLIKNVMSGRNYFPDFSKED